MNNENTFGSFLVSKRLEHEISARELSNALGISAVYMYHFQADFRFSWIDEIQNDELYLKVVSLPEKDKELLTMIAVDGFLQREIADIRGIAPSAICKKMKKLRKFLNGG